MIYPTDSNVHQHRVKEVFKAGDPGLWVHPDWDSRFPWLAQGTTEGDRDFALTWDVRGGGERESWEVLGARLGFGMVVQSRQVHGREVLVHERKTGIDGGVPLGSGEKGRIRLVRGADADGHLTAVTGILMGVTVADCVPVFLLDPARPGVGLLHAGWRGVASGILEEGVTRMAEAFGSRPRDLLLHLGPAICGTCYEVGPEVHRALGLPDPGRPSPMDLRRCLAERALAGDVDGSGITISAWCTLCDGPPFFSHRRGDPGRQMAFVGIGGRE